MAIKSLQRIRKFKKVNIKFIYQAFRFLDVQNGGYDGSMNNSFYGSGGHKTTSSCFCSSNFVAPYTRLNREYRDRKHMGIYFTDSSYLNASNPNSMIDQGMLRNAPYRVDIKPCYQSSIYSRRMTKSSERPSTAYVSGNIKNRDFQNHTFYSFGGRTPMKSQYSKHREPQLNSTFSSILEKQYTVQQQKEPIKYKHDPLVRVQDYTKNMSQEIFSPGFSFVTKVNSKFDSPISKSNGNHHRRFTNKSKVVKNLHKELTQEKIRTKSLQKDIIQLKELLNSVKSQAGLTNHS